MLGCAVQRSNTPTTAGTPSQPLPSLHLTHSHLSFHTMRPQPLAGWRALGTGVLAAALAVLFVVWCTHTNPGHASEHVPGVQPQARAVGSIKTSEEESWNAVETLIRTGKVSSLQSGLVVDVEEMVRDCAGGKDSERCQRGAFLYIRDDKTLQSIHDLRDEDMHRIHVRGEKKTGMVSMAYRLQARTHALPRPIK